GTKPPGRQAKDEPYNIYPDVQYIGEFLTKDLAGEVYSFYFGSGSWILGPRQEQVLREYVVPMLNMTGSLVEIYALSDRSGSKKSNYELSQHRLGFVENMLTILGADHDLGFSPKNKYFWEGYAAYTGLKDGTSFFYQRCVQIWWWPNYQSSIRVFNDRPFLQYARSTPQPNG